MKNILVPTDFSPNAALAFSCAVELAKKAATKVVLMHSCDLYEEKFIRYKSLVHEHNRGLVKDLFNQLNALRNEAKSRDGVSVEVSLYNGAEITEAILQAGRDHQAGLVVMGTYGTSGLRRKLFGSKTASLINRSEVPVLTIPPSWRWAEPKTLVLAISDEAEDTEVLKPAFELAGLFGARVSVVVFTEEDADAFELLTHTKNIHFIEQKLRRVFPATTIKVQHFVGHDFHESMQRLILEEQADVLAMITHRRKFPESIFDASMTQKMSYHASVPLLSLHAS